MSPKAYLKASSHRFYGAVIALVMLLLYEVLILLGNTSGYVIRNAPEAWLRGGLHFLGISHYHISFVLLTVSIIAIPVFYRSDLVLKKRIFGYLVIEAVFWGSISGLIIQFFVRSLFMAVGRVSGSLIGDLGLAIGAGLFEELLFRVVLTTVLIWSTHKIVRIKWLAIMISVIIASLAFSLAHYIGNAADVFGMYSFLFRFIAGLWFTTLYSVRGFALVCLTHAFYDILIVLL